MKTTQYNLYGKSAGRVSSVKSLFIDLDFFFRSYSAALKNPLPAAKKPKNKK